MSECKYPTCSVDREDGSKFCSTRCELKFEHVKADAEDARRSEERERGYKDEPHPEEL
jgi:hypothetical protein